ncbi:unnamed protein product [Brachionus calyciflorus]|uniref:Uncharacterized protein n=1 Tax=Brachionus calyciflorus TaxID=104777 RepID=A0A813VDU8_9BILA|nr:unnamed protein product [Brachionus calyciflorus]
MEVSRKNLLDFYSNTINQIDLKFEIILINQSENEYKINEIRSKLLNRVRSIQKHSLNEKTEKKIISKFCFFIPNLSTYGNLVITNKYLDELSIKSITNNQVYHKQLENKIISELIKSKKESLIIDLTDIESNFITTLCLEDYVIHKEMNNLNLNELRTILNLDKIKKFVCKNFILDLRDCNIQKSLETLIVNSCQISSLNSLENWSSLRLVDLSFNNLSRIEFKNLKNLEKLCLNGNNLMELDKNSFQGLIRLEELDLKDNCINFIRENTFQDLKNLVKLNISRNGKIKIDAKFDNMKKLKCLNLNNNQIDYLNLKGLDNLEYLELGKVFNVVFSDCEDLKFLKIEIESLPDLRPFKKLIFLVIDGLKSLENEVFLSQNNLLFLTIKSNENAFFSNLERKYFYGLNELKCFKLEVSCQKQIDNYHNYFENLIGNVDEISVRVEKGSKLEILVKKVPYSDIVYEMLEKRSLFSKVTLDRISNFVCNYFYF